jgi:hypothetical protein
MNVIAEFGLGMAGFLLGNLLFSKVGRWLATIYSIAKAEAQPGSASKAGRIASASMFHSGPWFAMAYAVFAYYVHSKIWAVPIFVGTIVAIVLFTVLGLYMVRKLKRQKQANAA